MPWNWDEYFKCLWKLAYFQQAWTLGRIRTITLQMDVTVSETCNVIRVVPLLLTKKDINVSQGTRGSDHFEISLRGASHQEGWVRIDVVGSLHKFLALWFGHVNPYPADHDYCRFQPVLLVDQITDIGNEIGVKHQDLQMFGLKLNKSNF